MLDIFNDNAFSVASLTEAINTVPYIPKRIGSMGIFTNKYPRTPTAFIERKGNQVSIIPTKTRGSGETTKRPSRRRDILPIAIPYVPYEDAVLASDVSGIREFDTEGQLEMASGEVASRLTDMRQDHEATHEFFRIGALKGQVIDADEELTLLMDVFDAFGIEQHEVYFNLAGSGEGIKGVCADIIAWIEEILGGSTYDFILGVVGNGFYQALCSNDEVKSTKNEQTNFKWGDVQQGSGTQGRGTNQVTFGDITFENYRGKIGDVPFIGDNDAHFFPMGVRDLFQAHFAPAETMSEINTPGKVVYAMQERKRFDIGVDIHTESNPLHICTRPSLLVLGHSEESSA